MNLRNAPIDKRRLKAEDRGFDTSSRQKALAQAKARRGQIKYQQNKPMRTTTQRAGTGGFTQGIGIQQQRMRDIGTAQRRAKELRPDSVPQIPFKRPEDPA